MNLCECLYAFDLKVLFSYRLAVLDFVSRILFIVPLKFMEIFWIYS